MDGDDAISSRVEALGGKLTRCRALASYIVIDDVKRPGVRNELAMVLNGGCLIARACFESSVDGLGNGVRIAFKNLLSQPKWICLTTGFRSMFGGLALVIDQAIQAQTKRHLWKSLTYDDFVVWFSFFPNFWKHTF